MADEKRYAHVRSRLQGIGQGTGQQVHDAMEKPNPYSVREVENVLDELVQKEPEEFEKAGEAYRWRKSYRFRIDEAVDLSLENRRTLGVFFPVYLRSGEKLVIEQRSDGFYWVLGEEEGGPFDSEGEAHEGFKRYGGQRADSGIEGARPQPATDRRKARDRLRNGPHKAPHLAKELTSQDARPIPS